MNKDNKKNLIFMVIGAITLIAVTLGATYAYFIAQGGGSANTNVNVQTSTTDNLSFQVGEAISLTANQEDFAQGMGNKSGSTTARATLTANNATNNATANYYIYLDIANNDFVYTTEDNQAEKLLKVTDPNGTEVTSIPGLTRKTSGSGENEVTGFDITTQTGLITIADNYEIISTGTVTQEWTVEIIFVNLDSDQNANTNKTFNANLIIQEEAIAYHEMCDETTFACQIANLYTTDGENGIYYHDGAGTYGTLEAGDNSYRFSGANPNNYVCFGSDEESCPADNLYRIIGVFGNQVKLIKHDYANSDLLGTNGSYSSSTYSNTSSSYYKGSKTTINRYYWNRRDDTYSTNAWSSSRLNTINLNTTYYNTLGSEWTDKIATTNWKVGGNATSNIMYTTQASAYQNEIVNPAESTTYSAKIGLMYVSDYGYATSPENWNTDLYEYDNDTNRNNNWMFMGLSECTISRCSESTDYAFRVDSSGHVSRSIVHITDSLSIRPVFYLESSVVLESGDGTQENPYRIAI